MIKQKRKNLFELKPRLKKESPKTKNQQVILLKQYSQIMINYKICFQL